MKAKAPHAPLTLKPAQTLRIGHIVIKIIDVHTHHCRLLRMAKDKVCPETGERSETVSSKTLPIGLVGSASQKLRRLAAARDLHVAQLFKKASAYAEQTCNRWYVLSAKHGLVNPGTVLEPYDVRLGASHRTSPPIHQWC
jgi:hypothetical protein